MPPCLVALQRVDALGAQPGVDAEPRLGLGARQVGGAVDLAFGPGLGKAKHGVGAKRADRRGAVADARGPGELPLGEGDLAGRSLVVIVTLPARGDRRAMLGGFDPGHRHPDRAAVAAGKDQVALLDRDPGIAVGRREKLVVDPGPDLRAPSLAMLQRADHGVLDAEKRAGHADPEGGIGPFQPVEPGQNPVIMLRVQLAPAIAADMGHDAAAAKHVQPRPAGGAVDRGQFGRAAHAGAFRTEISNGSNQSPRNQLSPPCQISPDRSLPRGD